MHFRSILALGASVALLAACNSSEDVPEAQQAEVAAPEPVMTPAPVATAAPDGTALVEGTWNVNEDSLGARATYGLEGLQASFAMACDRRSGAVTLSLASSAAVPEAWRLDAGGEAARIDLTPVGGAAQELVAQVDAGLAIIHALGDQGQVFVLTSPQGQPFQFPTHPGIRRVIDSCSQNSPDTVVPVDAPIR